MRSINPRRHRENLDTRQGWEYYALSQRKLAGKFRWKPEEIKFNFACPALIVCQLFWPPLEEFLILMRLTARRFHDGK